MLMAGICTSLKINHPQQAPYYDDEVSRKLVAESTLRHKKRSALLQQKAVLWHGAALQLFHRQPSGTIPSALAANADPGRAYAGKLIVRHAKAKIRFYARAALPCCSELR